MKGEEKNSGSSVAEIAASLPSEADWSAAQSFAGARRPVRVQLKRTKGWRMPPNTVKVDRSTGYGNPFDWRDWLENAPRDALETAAEREIWAKEQATEEFRDALSRGDHAVNIGALRGKNLACWCKGPRFSCHADVLLDLANCDGAQ